MIPIFRVAIKKLVRVPVHRACLHITTPMECHLLVTTRKLKIYLVQLTTIFSKATPLITLFKAMMVMTKFMVTQAMIR